MLMFSVGHLGLIIIISNNFFISKPFNTSINCFYFQNNSLTKVPLQFIYPSFLPCIYFLSIIFSPFQTTNVETDSMKTICSIHLPNSAGQLRKGFVNHLGSKLLKAMPVALVTN